MLFSSFCRRFSEGTMLRICTRTMVKVWAMYPCGSVKPGHLVKHVSATLIAGRSLTHQKDLPRMPVPPLQQTCERYLTLLEAVVEVEELKHTKELVEEFQKAGGVGERLQRCLERRARNTENWSTGNMEQFHYFKSQKPVVVYSNAGWILPRRMDFRDKQGQKRCAAKLIAAVLEFKTMIDNETLPVEYMRGKPLCMELHSQLLSSCRIPGLEMDSTVFHAKGFNPPKHITVVHNSQFFALDVYNNDGTLLTVDQLYVQLEKICNSSTETNTEPVGILTTMYRDSWRKAYVNLVKDKTNKESVSAIERSICTVCLDGAMPQMSDEMYSRCAALRILHGGGSQWNSANRWFDKGLQFIIGEDGTCGGNMSHSISDGSVCALLVEYVAAFIENRKKPEMMQSPMVSLPMPQKLHFNITSDTRKDIEEAKQSMDIIAKDLDLRVKVFDHFGKNALKAYKIGPDAFIQMAIQLACYRMYRQCIATYEAASLRMFKRGRVGVIPSTSRESVTFVKAFDDAQKQNTEKLDLLETAMKVHRWNTNMVIRGQGIHEHLLFLYSQAIEENISMPDIFTDTSFKKAFNFKLTTSQMTFKTGYLPVAGPEHWDTYFMCYSLSNNDITFVVTAFNSCKENNVAQLIQATDDALLDMMSLLEQTPRAN